MAVRIKPEKSLSSPTWLLLINGSVYITYYIIRQEIVNTEKETKCLSLQMEKNSPTQRKLLICSHAIQLSITSKSL